MTPKKPLRCRLGWHALTRLTKFCDAFAWWVCPRCSEPERAPRMVVPAFVFDAIVKVEAEKQ